MSDLLSVDAKFLPYGDGSGHQMRVVVDQEYPGGPAMIWMEVIHSFDAEMWPDIRDEIERMISLFPPASKPKEKSNVDA